MFFHICRIKISSRITQAKKIRGSMPHKYEVRDVLKTLEKAGLESRTPAWDKERVIMQEGHKALKDDMASS